jgi:transcriptional regulator with XRE-family HTH domain
MTGLAEPNAFGEQLRSWRRQRGWSQLALAAEAGTTPRHLSFLETGRSRPGADMVLRLAHALDVPLRERDHLLRAAGFSPALPAEDLQDRDLVPFRAAVERMLAAHEPFPGLVFDRHWNVVAATASGEAMLAAGPERNMVRLLLDPDGAWRRLLENWDHVAGYVVAQLQDDVLRFPHDEQLRELEALARRATAGRVMPVSGLAASPRLRLGDQVVATISVIARFAAPRDAFAEELRVELLHPADDDAAAVLRRLVEPDR